MCAGVHVRGLSERQVDRWLCPSGDVRVTLLSGTSRRDRVSADALQSRRSTVGTIASLFLFIFFSSSVCLPVCLSLPVSIYLSGSCEILTVSIHPSQWRHVTLLLTLPVGSGRLDL